MPGLIYGIRKASFLSLCMIPVRKTDIITLFRFDQSSVLHDQNAFIIVDRGYYCLLRRAGHVCVCVRLCEKVDAYKSSE